MEIGLTGVQISNVPTDLAVLCSEEMRKHLHEIVALDIFIDRHELEEGEEFNPISLYP